jgi:transcriptional regulator with XRE-family HTH domain
MLFANKIKELREEKHMLQRHVSAALDIDNAMYCKIERGDRQAKREQVLQLSKLFDADQNELLNLWLADKVYDIVSEEDNAGNVLSIVAENIVEYQKIK